MNLFAELKQRHVFRVAAGYLLLAWLALQVTDVLVSLLQLPDWVGRATLYMVALGFPLALLGSWVFEWTPQGLKRESDLDRAALRPSSTGRAVDFVIITLLVALVGYLAWDRVHPEPAPQLERSLAVLPVGAIGLDESSGFFAAGMHDALLTELVRIPDLRVITRSGVLAYASDEPDVRAIARKLGVAYIVKASVQKIGDDLRVVAQLIDAEADTHLWSDTIDDRLTFDNFFDVQSRIVRRIASSLRAEISDTVIQRAQQSPTTNLEAYRDYVEARQRWYDLDNPTRGQDTMALLRSAVEKDPDFALAWAHLARGLALRYWWSEDAEGVLAEAEAALAKARRLDPELPELHLAEAELRYRGYRDFDGALEELARAEALMPGDAEVLELQAMTYRQLDRTDEALEAFEAAIARNPLNTGLMYEYGQTLALDRRYAEAARWYDAAIERFPDVLSFHWTRADVDYYRSGDVSGFLKALAIPDFPARWNVDAMIAQLAWLGGDATLALAHARQVAPDTPGMYGFRVDVLLPVLMLETGEAEEAQRQLDGLAFDLEKQLEEVPENSRTISWLAAVEMFRGNEDRALALAHQLRQIAERINPAQASSTIPVLHGHALCHAGDFSAAASAFREVLSGKNKYTLASLMADWPPCRERFVGSEEYEELAAEFAHLAKG